MANAMKAARNAIIFRRYHFSPRDETLCQSILTERGDAALNARLTTKT
jgi:hypothetical protein